MRRFDPCIYSRSDADAQMDPNPERSYVDLSSSPSTVLCQFFVKRTVRYLEKGGEMEPEIYTTSKDCRISTQDTSEQRHEKDIRLQTIAVAGLRQSCDSTILELLFEISGNATYSVCVTIRAQQYTLNSYACEQFQIFINSPITQKITHKALNQLAMNLLKCAGEKHMTCPRDVERLNLRLADQSVHHANESDQQQVTHRAHTNDYFLNLCVRTTQCVAWNGSFKEKVTAGERMKSSYTTYKLLCWYPKLGASGRLAGIGRIQDITTDRVPLDLLTATVDDLRQLLSRGEVHSVDLIEEYIDQIHRHNRRGMKLNAVISTAPKELVIREARRLDQERAEGKVRGPLHGIPVIVKDTFNTHPALGMRTTCGSYALEEIRPRRNAAVVDLLQEAGMIIIAKTSLSELGNFKGFGVTGGWSAVGRQGQSPYVRGGVTPNATFLGHSTPCGSSSGSAIGVAAGFAPVSVGSECDGSIVQPACRAALYGMKATPGVIPDYGAFPTSRAFDSHGGMAKTPNDLADIMGVLMDRKDFTSSLKSSWKGINIGFVDPDLWQPASFVVEANEDFRVQTYRAMSAAIAKIHSVGGSVRTNVPLVSLADLAQGNTLDFDTLLGAQYEEVVNEYLRDLDYSPTTSMKDIVDFNKKNADRELPPDHPGQQVLEGALGNSMAETEFQKHLTSLRSHARNEIMKSLAVHDVDVIFGPADARMASVAAAAGYPVGVVPLGFADFNGRAFGMNIIAEAGQEYKILHAMSAWAATFPDARKPPPMLVDWKL